MFKKVIVTLSSLLFFNPAFAIGSATLNINVGGAVYPQPYWTVGGTQGTGVTYTFTYYSGISSGNYNLDSAPNTLQLVIAAGAPVSSTVTLTTPTGCSIGGANGTSISNGDVKFVTNDEERTSGSVATSVFTQANQVTKLRFKNVPSAATGTVSCGGSGSLTYSF